MGSENEMPENFSALNERKHLNRKWVDSSIDQ